MHKYHIKYLLLIVLTLLLTACGFFDKDNTPIPAPLPEFEPEFKPRLLWSKRTGASIGNEYLRISPAISDCAIYTVNDKGIVSSFNKMNGSRNWRRFTYYSLISSPAVGEGVVVVGGLHGEVVALSETDGKILWATSVPGEVLAKPAIGRGMVIIKTVDGYLRALSLVDGHELWSLQQVEPNLILRASSAPLIYNNHIIVGFANGNLAKVNLYDGQITWQQQLASPEGSFAIQRMIDIDADPILFNQHLYAATYQGNIASLDWVSGSIIWSHTISSYTGMVASSNTIYISDANGLIWSFNAHDGLVNWRQINLRARGVTGPVMMGNYIVVGDQQGYLHWLDKEDGHFATRIKVGAKLFAAPIVENNILYAINNKGYLVAYTCA